MNQKVVSALAVLAMALMMIGVMMTIDWPSGPPDDIDSKEVAKTMFGTVGGAGYGLIVLLVGVLLLVALLGGVFLAKEEEKE